MICEGNGSVPFFYFQNLKTKMNTSEESAKIEEFVRNLIEAREDLFVIEVKITPANKVTVFLDGDNGVTIHDCTKVNKALYKLSCLLPMQCAFANRV